MQNNLEKQLDLLLWKTLGTGNNKKLKKLYYRKIWHRRVRINKAKRAQKSF